MFGIFTEDKAIESEFNETVLPAYIIIGDFKEGLQIPVTYWSVEQYYASWLACLEEGIRDESKSTLVVSMYAPKDINFLFSWILYFRGENVIIQNKIIFSEGIDDFSINRLNEYAGEYEAYSDGEKVSEWYTTVDEVREFICYLKGNI